MSNSVGILIIVGIIILGVISGGAIFGNKKDKQSDDKPKTESSGGFFGSKTSNPKTEADNTKQIQKKINTVSKGVEDLSEEVSEYVENINSSIYKGKISISRVNSPGTFDEYVILKSGSGLTASIPISGWRLRSRVTGREISVGQAANLAVSPYTASVVSIPSKSTIVVSRDRSPLGASFRLNKCTGYLEEKRNFVPALPKHCPSPKEDLPALSNSYNNACLDYIERLPRCLIPDEDKFPTGISNACENYMIATFNYSACISLHKNDPDFYKNEWRMYKGGSTGIVFIKDREIIDLIDQYNKIVDTWGD